MLWSRIHQVLDIKYFIWCKFLTQITAQIEYPCRIKAFSISALYAPCIGIHTVWYQFKL